MVYMGRNLADIVGGRKSTDDFMREEQEFEARKKERAMKEQLMPLQLEQAKLGLEKTKNDMNSFDIDKIKNLAAQSIYEQTQGLPVTPQGRAAIEAMAILEGQKTQYKPDAEGRVTAVTQPNPYQQYMEIQGFNPDGPSRYFPVPSNGGPNPSQMSGGGGGQYDMDINPVPMTQDDVEAIFSGRDVGGSLDDLLRMNTSEGVNTGEMITSRDLLQVAPGYGDKTEQFAREQAIKLEAEKNDPKFLVNQETAARKAETRRKNIERSEGNIVMDMGRSINMVLENPNALGPLALDLKNNAPAIFRRSPAYAIDKMIQSVKSNISINEIMEMKQGSETGGALGQIPVQQQEYLMELRGSLDIGQPADILMDNMKRIHNISMDMVHGTPQQIQELVEQGKVSPDAAARNSQRYQLSFDEFGNPVDAGNSLRQKYGLE